MFLLRMTIEVSNQESEGPIPRYIPLIIIFMVQGCPLYMKVCKYISVHKNV